ncbi:VanZ family protein [Paenibacillus tyrfis]|uniref:VanZ family protein n=1 Tax=Paenibacillus tyrfis TaxID=1501230 RepID=UPI0020A03D60|nr:VanZ family protein [Paenibacillus tyrfis]MCP1312294.1 VanZ family protein [Paenibacillus tyrfis]
MLLIHNFKEVIIILTGIPLGVSLVIAVILTALHNISTKKNVIKNLTLLIFYLHILVVISITLFPIPVQSNLLLSLKRGNIEPNMNFIPFKSIIDIMQNSVSPFVAVKQIAGNILMCAPFGFYAPLLFQHIKSPIRIVIYGILFGLCIELSQLIIGVGIGFFYRSLDVDDIILNTIGVTLGYAFLTLLKRFDIKNSLYQKVFKS